MIFVSNYICIFVLVKCTLTNISIEEWAQRIEVNDDQHSFYGVENWSLLHIMYGTKCLNPIFRLHEASEALSFSPDLSLIAVNG